MFKKVNMNSLIGSAVIGMVVSCIYQLVFMNNAMTSQILFIVLVTGGIIGLIIGALTEIITAMIPINLAKASTYIIINTIIGALITGFFLTAMPMLMNFSVPFVMTLKILSVATIVIIIVNAIEYMTYQRLNKQLELYKSKH